MIAGLHIEGPFINVAKAGAQNPEFVREPDFDPTAGFIGELGDTIESLAEFVDASEVRMPRGWMSSLG